MVELAAVEVDGVDKDTQLVAVETARDFQFVMRARWPSLNPRSVRSFSVNRPNDSTVLASAAFTSNVM